MAPSRRRVAGTSCSPPTLSCPETGDALCGCRLSCRYFFGGFLSLGGERQLKGIAIIAPAERRARTLDLGLVRIQEAARTIIDAVNPYRQFLRLGSRSG